MGVNIPLTLMENCFKVKKPALKNHCNCIYSISLPISGLTYVYNDDSTLSGTVSET